MDAMSNMEFVVANCPSQDLAKTNQAYVSPGTLNDMESALWEIGPYVFTVCEDDGVERGRLGLNAIQRRGLRVSSGDRVRASVFHLPKAPFQVALVSVEVELISRRGGEQEAPAPELTAHLRSRLTGQVLSAGQEATFELHGTNFLLRVASLDVVDAGTQTRAPRGILIHDTVWAFEARAGGGLKVTGQRALMGSSLFKTQDVSFSKLGIGGLDAQFHEMFRRAFHSRLLSPALAERLGIKHVKGMLLYGPPGTGKTLIARQIGRMLNGREPKIVNGPEVLNKYVGASEENVRNLFKDAEADYAKHGDDSELHVIIFDEIDAICKSRGSVRDGSGVHDTIVNQLLTKIDGVDALNNILIIGMTNRRELLDTALLREGRLEVHMEIGLPDEAGRLQIFAIHTRRMSENSFLAPDVDLHELAARTPNFSGAEIEGLVRSAASFALDREIDISALGRAIDESAIRVTRADFLAALQEVTPAFGAENEQLAAFTAEGVLDYGADHRHLTNELRKLVKAARESSEATLLTAVLHGQRGTGKSALAAAIALESHFPYVKLVGPDAVAGLSEHAKCQHIMKVFEDAYRSPLSLIILDDVERLIEYIFLGPRFSNSVLQDLLTCLARKPPPGRRLLVLVTTSTHRVLQLLGGPQAFTEEHQLEPLTLQQAAAVIDQAGDAAGLNFHEANAALASMGADYSVPVKRLMLLLRLARQGLAEGETTVPRPVFDELIQHSKLLPTAGDYFDPGPAF